MKKFLILGLIGLSLAGCQNTGGQTPQLSSAAVISAAVCALDTYGMNGKPLKMIKAALKDPNCLAALNSLTEQGVSPDAPVTAVIVY